MALVIADRVRETTTSTGTGTITLAGPYTGFQAFSVIGNGNTTYYALIDAATGTWEVGIGTYTATGNTLSRDTVLSSSNGGAAVNFSAGTKDVIITQPASRAVYLDTASNVTIPGITLSGGTANGVAYLNGSKVLTTGSALTFDGTNLGVGGTPSVIFHTKQAGSTYHAVERTTAGSEGILYIGATSSSNQIISQGASSAAKDLTFQIGSAEQMRLTSTGLGIGTSSITAGTKLDVNGAVYSRDNIYVNATSAFIVDINGGYGLKIVGGGSGSVAIQTNGSIKATYDAAGNLGLGVTPSAWKSSYKGFDIGTGGLSAAASIGLTQVTSNAYYNASNQMIYKITDAASYYQQYSGQHQWFTAPSGTAGTAISFTQAMTLGSNGSLGIGATSPSYVLNTNYTAPSSFTNAGGDFTQMWQASGTNALGVALSTGDSTARFVTNNGYKFAWNIASTQAMTLDASGNLLVGSTSINSGVAGIQVGSGKQIVFDNGNANLISNLDVPVIYGSGSGGSFGFNGHLVLQPRGSAAGAIIMATGSGAGAMTERARIDSSGNVGIGTSSPPTRLSYSGSFDAAIAGRYPSATGVGSYGGGIGFIDSNASGIYTQDNGGTLMFFTGQSPSDTAASKVKMRIDVNGNLGLGVTPNTWYTGTKALEIGATTALMDISGQTNLYQNAYLNSSGALVYKTSNYATQYRAISGQHQWMVAPSGTAGNAISFTQAMTLDASGRFLIGTTSATSSGGFLQIGQVPNSTSSSIGFNNNDNAVISAKYSLVFQVDNTNTVGSRDFSWKKGGYGYGDGTTLMSLDSTGALTATGTYNFSGGSNLAQINNYRSSDLEIVNRVAGTGINFYVGAGNYVAKFTSDKKLLVGTTSNSGSTVRVASEANAWTFQANDIYRVFNNYAAYGSTSSTRTCSIAFTSQSNNWSGHVVEIIFAGSWDVSSAVVSGKATYAVTSLTSLAVGEIEDIGTGVSFSASASGATLTITATTTTVTNWAGWTVRVTSSNNFSAPTSISIA